MGKPTANMMFNDERLNAFSLRRKQGKDLCSHHVYAHYTGGPRLYNRQEKEIVKPYKKKKI